MEEIIEPKGIIGEILKTGQMIQDNRSVNEIFLQLSEEVGELATEISVLRGYSKKPQGKDGVVGEAIDVVICAIDILYVLYRTSEEDIDAKIREKLAKWRAKS
jgi:NTP pyrophosphatase (non-canonical NTP hydrolase)